jgi:predicted RecB family nuclease
MLAFHGLDGNGTGGIVGVDQGSEAHVIYWIDLGAQMYDRNRKSAMQMYAERYAEAHAVASCASRVHGGERGVEPVTRPEWKSECKACVWREHCQERLVETDDPTLLAGMTVKVARKLRDGGINTIAQLARLDTTTAAILDSKIEDLGTLVANARTMRQYANSPVGTAIPSSDGAIEDGLVKHNVTTVGALAALDLETAKLPSGISLVSHIDQARVVDYAKRKKMTHIFRARGVHAISIPRGNVEIHTDMEADGIIYCWGNYLAWRNPNTGKVRTSYHAFVTFERSDTEEARVFAEYWAFLQKWQAEATEEFGADTYKVFHYTQAEDRCMRHLAKKHAGVEGIPSLEDVDRFLGSDAWVDLYPLLTDGIIWPTEDHSLKSLAKYVRFMWRDTDPSGANSTLWYAKASDPTLSETERSKWQKRLLQYNEDDVQATAALVEFVDRFTKVYDMSKKLPPVEDLEPRYRRAVMK